MSVEALLDAVRDRIRNACRYADDQCDVQPDGSPPPDAGEVYVSVHPQGFRNEDDYAHALNEVVEIGVTLTMRAAWLPVDRQGNQMVAKASTGLYARAEAIRAAVHMDYVSMNAANTTIGASENGFVEPLKFRSCSAPQLKGPDWFNAEGQGGDPAAGWAVELQFGGARRVQVIEEQS